MEITRDQSYGVVPVTKQDKEWHVLLVHQISYHGSNDSFWTFPKGHSENNETPLETAERELVEETGIKNVRLVEEAKFSIEYSFKHEDRLIEKTVSYYLGICEDSETTITLPNEIADLTWMKFSEAMEKLTHENTRKVLIEAGQFISANEDKL